jgi:hypothetical protein
VKPCPHAGAYSSPSQKSRSREMAQASSLSRNDKGGNPEIAALRRTHIS